MSRKLDFESVMYTGLGLCMLVFVVCIVAVAIEVTTENGKCSRGECPIHGGYEYAKRWAVDGGEKTSCFVRNEIGFYIHRMRQAIERQDVELVNRLVCLADAVPASRFVGSDMSATFISVVDSGIKWLRSVGAWKPQ